MTPEARRYYEASNAWAEARRRAFPGDRTGRTSRPSGPRHLGSRVSPAFVADLELLGWATAVLLDEENA